MKNAGLFNPLTRLYIAWFCFAAHLLANLLYALGGIILTWLAWRTPNFPRWLAWWGLGWMVMALGLSAAAFANRPDAIQFVFPLLFGLFLPWTLYLGYRWLVVANLANTEEQ